MVKVETRGFWRNGLDTFLLAIQVHHLAIEIERFRFAQSLHRRYGGFPVKPKREGRGGGADLRERRSMQFRIIL